jgi:glycosyltransferase involved in cell wall biosynthesis
MLVLRGVAGKGKRGLSDHLVNTVSSISQSPRLVTIGVPIYKRLEYLPQVLKIIEAQDYPAVQLLLSDNGLHGTKVRELAEAHYRRPYRFRQNAAIATASSHFNQLIEEANGEYFMLLCDDDEISENYVSELVSRLEAYPQASVAVARQELIDSDGKILRKTREPLPEILLGPDFVRSIWQEYEFGFECFATVLARTAEMRDCGGYPEFTRGNGNDNALLISLCLNSHVVFSSKCVFRWRIDETSHGWSVPIRDLAASTREFLHYLESAPAIRRYEAAHPQQWKPLKNCLVEMVWKTYLGRWQGLYRKRLSRMEWARAAFSLPYIPAYYSQVASVFKDAAKGGLKRRVKRFIPNQRHSASQTRP